jgi:phospholipase/carboxylesterase
MPQSNAHLLMRVERYGAPSAFAPATVVLVHGRGQDPEYMLEHFVNRLDRDDLAFIAPAAAGNSWYPTSFLAPLADNEPSLRHTMERMAQIRDELLDSGLAPQQIVWCGFSQGACVISQFVSLDPRRWGGLIALTGGLIGPVGTEWTIDGDLEGMPAYFTTSEADAFVPEFRVRDTAARFAAAGALTSVEFHLGRAHEICAAEIDRARFLLASLPAGATTPATATPATATPATATPASTAP